MYKWHCRIVYIQLYPVLGISFIADNFQTGETISGNVSVKRYISKWKLLCCCYMYMYVCDGWRSLYVLLCYLFDLFRNICTNACRIFVLILGDQFDVRDFHSVILRCGAGPMSFLEQEVDEYIRQKLIK